MNPIDTNRIAVALERIANALEHFNIEHAHIDEIDHNHVAVSYTHLTLPTINWV